MTSVGDKISLATGGVIITEAGGAGGERPTTPILGVVVGTNSAVATITGDSGVMNYLKYKAPSDSNWQDGGSRSGDGELTVSGLANNVPYVFVVYSIKDDVASLPSTAVTVTLAAAAANTFDELIKATAHEFLTEFGVPIKYKPKGGGSRAILAILNYEPPEDLGYGIQTEVKSIGVMNDPVEGISSSELNMGGDMVELAVNIGDVPMDRPIKEILSQDAGMMALEIK